MDLSLPKLDGLAVLEQLQADQATQTIPVIFLSARRDEKTVVKALNTGAVDYLSKPANTGELVARMVRALRQSRQHRTLQDQAQTDALTGLSNFRSLVGRLDEEFKRASRYHYPLAAAMIDLDQLKQINDRFGHEIGNEAITSLARQLRANLREVDYAARYGGDEFFVLLPHQTAIEAAVFAERLRAGLNLVRVSPGDGPHTHLSASIGVAGHWPQAPKHGAEQLLQAADAALYEAKRQGRNRVIVYERDLQLAAPDALRI
jgi:two-component system, cell cycle response regulator